MLTTSDGDPVLSGTGPITIPDGFASVSILPTGEINVERNGQTEYAGQVNVVEAMRPKLLETAGNNNFRLPYLAGLGFNFNDVIQGVNQNEDILQSMTLESSNVDMSKEMSDMVMTQRAYQFNARTISMGDQMMGLVNQIR